MFCAVVATWSLAIPAFADYRCSGTISDAGVNSYGDLYANIGPAPWALCSISVDTTYGGVAISAATCKSWLALLVAALRAGSSVFITIVSSTVTGTNPSQCGTIASGSTPGVLYVDSLAN
jgi:hypothetical protein